MCLFVYGILSVVRRGILSVAKQAIPVVGVGVGAAMNAKYLNDIAWAARRSFQERWLRDNGLLIDVESGEDENGESTENE